MPPRHLLLAVTVAALWGMTFIAINLSLRVYPPMLLAALRFAFIAIPAMIFLPKPKVELKWFLGYGIGFGTMQFVFLYWGLAVGMPAGLASLVLQSSAPFTVLLSILFLKERLTPLRILGIAIAITGLCVVGWQRAEHAAFFPFFLTMMGGLGWAIGNICNRQANSDKPFQLMMWMTTIPPIPMLTLSLIFEGPQRIADAVVNTPSTEGLIAFAALLFTVIFSTVIGSGSWSWLLSHYPAGMVAPFSLLVPVFGMTFAWLILGETSSVGELAGAALIVIGVLLGTISKRPASAEPVAAIGNTAPAAQAGNP